MSKDNKCGICRQCAYKSNIVGNTHISSNLDWGKSKYQAPTGNPHAIRNGWYIFPVNFDPTWQEEPCKEFSTDIDESKISKYANDPFTQMLQMLKL